jgi:hypothetical protein
MTIVSCQCGKVQVETTGRPILTASCFCNSCQKAGHQFEAMPSAPPVLDDDGGTGFVLYRKDRVQCRAGAEHLAEYRLTPGSATRRVLATCCNTSMFLDFEKGHWLTLYRSRFGATAPPIEMRVMTNDRPAGVVLSDTVPNYGGHSGRFFRKLMLAWLAMGFRRPVMALGRSRRAILRP